MDDTKLEVIGKITEKNTYWSEIINKNVVMASINEKKEVIIDRYEKVLNFLKGVPITNEQTLAQLEKHLNDLESNLKNIPNGPYFNDVIPTEIKDRILSLSYPCDSNAFIAASVCQEWKGVLENRFKNKKVIIEEVCSNYKCEDSECMKLGKAWDMLKAAVDHKLDVHLVISKQEVLMVDPQIVTDALTTVSKFTVINDYLVVGAEVLSDDQFEHLFKSVEKEDKVFEHVRLIGLFLEDLDQERLASFLANKVERLTLYDVRLNFETFITKLHQDSSTLKLTHLIIHDRGSFLKFEHLISPEDLKTVINKMATIQMEGSFTLEQLEAVRSLPDVEVKPEQFGLFYSIKKSSSGTS